MEIHGDIFVGIDVLWIGYDSFDGECFYSIDVFDIPDEILVAYFFGVGASGILPAE